MSNTCNKHDDKYIDVWGDAGTWECPSCVRESHIAARAFLPEWNESRKKAGLPLLDSNGNRDCPADTPGDATLLKAIKQGRPLWP
jgi:hypothetical protein